MRGELLIPLRPSRRWGFILMFLFTCFWVARSIVVICAVLSAADYPFPHSDMCAIYKVQDAELTFTLGGELD